MALPDATISIGDGGGAGGPAGGGTAPGFVSPPSVPAASIPMLGPAGTTVLRPNPSTGALEVSINGGAFSAVGGAGPFKAFSDGAAGIGFSPSFSDPSFPGIPGDTAGINVFNPGVGFGEIRNVLAGWINDADGNPVATFIEHGAGTGGAGAQFTNYTMEVCCNGSYIVAFEVRATSAGNAQITVPNGTVAAPGIAFQADRSQGFYQTIGAGPDYDMHLAVHGVKAYSFYETGTVGNLSHYLRALGSGTGQGGFLVSPTNATGLMYDPVSGGAYIDAQLSSMAVGPPGALATNATSGMLAMPTCAGTPIGTPANMVSGKVAMVVDTTASRLWAFIGGTWKSVVFS